MRQFFEIIICRYYTWMSGKEKDHFVNTSRITGFLGVLNIFQLFTFFSILQILYPSITNPIRTKNYLLALIIIIGFSVINYFIFFKGKTTRYYIDKYETEKKWRYTLYAIGYPLATLAVFVLVAILTKKILYS